MRIVSDNSKCVGCLACVITCIDHHYSEDKTDAVSGRLYKLTIESSGYTKYITESCRHCIKAACMDVCPSGAITRSSSGWVIVDQEQCTGCHACADACPFDVPRFNSDGKMIKCDGCGGEPSCVKICPNTALQIKI